MKWPSLEVVTVVNVFAASSATVAVCVCVCVWIQYCVGVYLDSHRAYTSVLNALSLWHRLPWSRTGMPFTPTTTRYVSESRNRHSVTVIHIAVMPLSLEGSSSRAFIKATIIRAYHVAVLRKKTCHENINDYKVFFFGFVCVCVRARVRARLAVL